MKENIQSFFPSISFEGEYLKSKRNGQVKEHILSLIVL